MSTILTRTEAEALVKMMLEPLGFDVPVLDYKTDGDDSFRLCYPYVTKKKIGYLWWKKTIEVTMLSPIWTGWCWEEAIEELNKWIQTKVGPRLVLADKFREQLGTHLLDNKLKE
jgi:hypothetical protein